MSNNVVILNGWLEIDRISPVPLKGQQTEGPLIHAWLYTDKPYLGGRHPLLLIDQPASILLDWARKSEAGAGLPRVVVTGKLVSYNESSLTLVKVIHFYGSDNPKLEWILEQIAALRDKTQDPDLRANLDGLLVHMDSHLAVLPAQMAGAGISAECIP